MSKKQKQAVIMILIELGFVIFLISMAAYTGRLTPQTLIVIGILMLIVAKFIKEAFH